MPGSKGLMTPRSAIFRSHLSASSDGSIASAPGFERSRWRACLRSPRFHGARESEEVRKSNERSGCENSSFSKRLMDSTCCAPRLDQGAEERDAELLEARRRVRVAS